MRKEELNMNERIAVHRTIHFGKPCVAGTRIPVWNVLELVRDGIAFAEIVRDYYLELTIEDVRACIQYARMTPGAFAAVHAELARVLGQHGEATLLQAYVVVEAGRHRIRKVPASDDQSPFDQAAG
jgi:uncharacterized protein (DUF433 family)